MGFIKDIAKLVLKDSESYQHQKQVYEPQKYYTPEEWVIHEQEESGKKWHGIPLSELSKLAQTVYHGKYVTVDEYDFLVFHYSSRADKKRFHAQCELDENGQLRRMPHNYYPGQWKDSADDFVEKANQYFSFKG